MQSTKYREINVRLIEYINKHYNGKFWAALFWDEKLWLYLSSNISKQEAKVVIEYPDDWNFIVSECRKFFKLISNEYFSYRI